MPIGASHRAMMAAAGVVAAAATPAQSLVDTWASGGAGSDGFAMVFEDSGGTDAPSIYVKDSGTPANDTDINLTDDWDALNSFLTYTAPSAKIVRQSDGDLKYSAHNLYINSASPANQSITVVNGSTYAVTITGSVSVTASGAATGTWTAGTNTFTAATTTLTLGSTSGSGTVHVYRTPADTTYLATTGSIRYALPLQYDSSNNAEGLLVEPEATNLIAESIDFSTTWVSIGGSITSGQASPDGGTNAFLFDEGGSTGADRLEYSVTVATSTAYSFSVYANANESNWIALATVDFTTPGNGWTYFNVSTGSVGTTAPGHTGRIEDVGGGWYRCSITFTTDAADTGGTLRIQLAEADNDKILPAGSFSVYIWQAQFETGSVPTSPIIATGATATRAADVLEKATSGLPWTIAGANSGYVKAQIRTDQSQYVYEFAQVAGSTNRNAVLVNSAKVRFFSDGGVDDTTTGTISDNVDFKHAFAFDTNDFAHTLNGAAVETDATCTPTASTAEFALGHRGNTNASQLSGLIKEILVLPERMSNANLVSITT